MTSASTLSRSPSTQLNRQTRYTTYKILHWYSYLNAPALTLVLQLGGWWWSLTMVVSLLLVCPYPILKILTDAVTAKEIHVRSRITFLEFITQKKKLISFNVHGWRWYHKKARLLSFYVKKSIQLPNYRLHLRSRR